MKHKPKLDSLRAFAVTGVLIDHYLPGSAIAHLLPLGSLGVQCFFVISGYLITAILLQAKDAHTSSGKVLKSFFARRFLRIFPPYYAMLIVCLILGVGFSAEALISSIFYVFNIVEAANPQASYDYLGHLWSLCIEEQFYLIWPWIVILIPSGKLFKISLGLIVFAVVSRWLLLNAGWDYISVRNLPTSQFDALIGGALLAQIEFNQQQKLGNWLNRNYRVLILAGVTLYAFSKLAPVIPHQLGTLGYWATSVVFMGVVFWAAQPTEKPSLLSKVFQWKPLMYVGKISYGIYLYQFMSLLFLYKFISMTGIQESIADSWLFVALWTCFTLAIAAISWHCFERPILRLKARFSY
ncbi:acyltransferase family protein [Cerasicoccus fimbriatus]|uniref:acyltransferase family protein n=1 Tax=Cerasicoccus fimbriatus TaxID=3014554 RepID=UPI0022B47FEE|nr:acyltransferase [Cerasicoccus sp. TK19100]